MGIPNTSSAVHAFNNDLLQLIGATTYPRPQSIVVEDR